MITDFFFLSGRIHIIDVPTCSEVDCLVESGAVCGIELLAQEQDRILVARVAQTRLDGSSVNNITMFAADGDSWDRVQLVRSTLVRMSDAKHLPQIYNNYYPPNHYACTIGIP